MPVLKNAKWEKFAQLIASGKSLQEGYGLAGYKEDRGNGVRLRKRKDVDARITELQAATASTIPKTVDDIIRQLDKAFRKAETNEMPAAMVSASMGQAKVLGLIVDKQVQVQKRIEDMNEDELRAFLGRSAA